MEFDSLGNCYFTYEDGRTVKDKYGKILGRLITRQSQRRDQVIWAYGLRNEKPPIIPNLRDEGDTSWFDEFQKYDDDVPDDYCRIFNMFPQNFISGESLKTIGISKKISAGKPTGIFTLPTFPWSIRDRKVIVLQPFWSGFSVTTTFR